MYQNLNDEETSIFDKVIAGEGAKDKILKYENDRAKVLELDKNRHKRP